MFSLAYHVHSPPSVGGRPACHFEPAQQEPNFEKKGEKRGGQKREKDSNKTDSVCSVAFDQGQVVAKAWCVGEEENQGSRVAKSESITKTLLRGHRHSVNDNREKKNKKKEKATKKEQQTDRDTGVSFALHSTARCTHTPALISQIIHPFSRSVTCPSPPASRPPPSHARGGGSSTALGAWGAAPACGPSPRAPPPPPPLHTAR